MAKVTFRGLDAYKLLLERYWKATDDGKMLEKAVAAGAGVVADQIKSNLQALPTEKFRALRPGETFRGLSETQKQDLIDSFGLTPIDRDKHGFLHTKAGFDGYGSRPTKKYPNGVPNPLLARSVESGSSVREKHPFVRPAVNATRGQAVAEMQKVLDGETKKIMK